MKPQKPEFSEEQISTAVDVMLWSDNRKVQEHISTYPMSTEQVEVMASRGLSEKVKVNLAKQKNLSDKAAKILIKKTQSQNVIDSVMKRNFSLEAKKEIVQQNLEYFERYLKYRSDWPYGKELKDYVLDIVNIKNIIK